jgi:hypothetical protein
LGGHRRSRAKVSSADPVSVNDLPDVLALCNAVIADSWALDNSPARSRVLLAAADVAMRCLQVGELEARVRALEARLNGSVG